MGTLTVEQFKQALPPNMAQSVNQELVDLVNSALSDPEAMEIFTENLLSYTSVLQMGKFKLSNYINAVRYVGFKVMGLTNKDAYIRTFPEKYEDFLKRGISEKDIASYITAYNKSKLVNLIFAQTQIPTYVLNAPLYQRALNVQAHLMMNSKSDMVKFNAANSILTHLKPPEAAKVELDVNIRQDTYIADLEAAMRQMAKMQQDMIAQGGNLKQIVNTPIKTIPGTDVIDVQYDDVVPVGKP